MQGEFIRIWPETWREIWQPLIDLRIGEKGEVVPEDIFCDLYRELAKALKEPLSLGGLADIIDDPVLSREKFEKADVQDFAGERALVSFFESTHAALREVDAARTSARFSGRRLDSRAHLARRLVQIEAVVEGL